jgi:hypothetical protein
MHLDVGRIRAYQDQELEPREIERIREHLESCEACANLAFEISARADLFGQKVQHLAPTSHKADFSPAIARVRLAERETKMKERGNMFNKYFQTRYRPAWVAMSVLAILLVSLAFPEVRAIAGNFLGLFRVEQIAIIEVNPVNFPQQLGSSVMFEQIISQDVAYEEFGEPQEVASAAEANALTGMNVRLPQEITEQAHLWAQFGAEVSFNVELQRLQQLLEEIGQSEIVIPRELDGVTATLNIPPSVVAAYGECDLEEALQDPNQSGPGRQTDCTVLIQMPSPTISAPAGLNLAQLGQAFLQIMGLSPEEALQFSQTVDWATTLIIPIPRNDVEYKDVTIDGVQGTWIQQGANHRAPNFMLLWVKDNVVYALTGQGDGTSGLLLANSLK